MSVHLFTRSSYSFLNSTIQIHSLVQKAKAEGFSHVALTDHNVMYGMAEFKKECQKEKIHPIFGLEIDVNYHDEVIPFLLLAKNNTGYKNLMRLSTIFNSEHRAVTVDELKQYSMHNFLIVYGENGWIDHDIIQEDRDAIYKKLSIMKQELPSFDVAVSYQDSSLWRMKNRLLKQICRQLKISTVALNKIYYLEKEDDVTYRNLRAIDLGKKMNDNNLPLLKGRYYLSRSEFESLYDAEDIERTDAIASECMADMEIKKTALPEFDIPKNVTAMQYLTQLCLAGLKKRLNREIESVYLDRLKYELRVIQSMHFENYFLIVFDYIRWARKQGIFVGPGRGSAVGSLVAYSLGITQIDPLQYNLLFERFLNTDRKTMPDIDTDFPDNRRNEVIDYVHQKYGDEHVCNVVTFATFKARQAIQDIGKLMDLSPNEIKMLTEKVPQDPKITLREALEQTPKLREIVQGNEKYKQLIQYAFAIEGLPRQAGVHAAGIVMSSEPLEDVIPLTRQQDAIYTCQYPKEYLEERGLIKMDFLSLKNLTVIDEIVSNLKKVKPSFSIMTIPLDDAKTYSVFSRSDTSGVFQFESNGMRNLLRQMKPSSFGDIVACNALFRPGASGDINTYLEGKRNPSAVHYPIPELKPVLEETYGIMLYQEQVMLTAEIAGGFSPAKADAIRQAVSKKKEDVLVQLSDDFIKGCLRNGYSEEIAKSLYASIEKFGGYGFNKSHAVAYSLISYQMAWLKSNYPLYFYASFLNSTIGKDVKSAQTISECRRSNIQIYYPNINRSTNEYMIENRGLLIPLTAVHKISEMDVRKITEEREKGAFKDFYDFVARVNAIGIKRESIELLIKAGALDDFHETRSSLIACFSEAMSYASLVKIDHGDTVLVNMNLVSKPPIVKMNENPNDVREWEKEALGFTLSAHPIIQERQKHNIHLAPIVSVQQMKNVQIECFAQVDSVRSHKTKAGKNMAFVQVSDETGVLELLIWPSLWSTSQTKLVRGTYILFHGRLDEGGKCLTDRIEFISESTNA